MPTAPSGPADGSPVTEHPPATGLRVAAASPTGGPPKANGLLRVALPNKGALSEATVDAFRAAGYRQRSTSRELAIVDSAAGVEFYYLRPRDIATYVGEGTLDVGVTGQDLLTDSGSAALIILPLDYAEAEFRFAAADRSISQPEDLRGRRIATSYPNLVSRWLAEHGIDARLVPLDGAVESSIRLGVADAIADVVETGSTLRQNGLTVFGPVLLTSTAVMIGRDGVDPALPVLDLMIRRLRGVMVARNYLMVDYDVPAEAVDAATELTPGLESPTVSPLAREGWFAVRAMVPRDRSQQLMDQLWEVGARAILLTDIHACRI
jgi:ATP phosphoribosyltransferase